MSTDARKVFIAWTNTDLTEGRGWEYPLAICELEATANRLGKGNYVQGSDCRVTEFTAVYHGGYWCAPYRLVAATDEDHRKEAQIADARRRKAARDAAIEKAKQLGLSEDDIAALKGEKA